MDYLTPELLRILEPGRVAAIHVKDRVLFGNVTGTGTRNRRNAVYDGSEQKGGYDAQEEGVSEK